MKVGMNFLTTAQTPKLSFGQNPIKGSVISELDAFFDRDRQEAAKTLLRTSEYTRTSPNALEAQNALIAAINEEENSSIKALQIKALGKLGNTKASTDMLLQTTQEAYKGRDKQIAIKAAKAFARILDEAKFQI